MGRSHKRCEYEASYEVGGGSTPISVSWLEISWVSKHRVLRHSTMLCWGQLSGRRDRVNASVEEYCDNENRAPMGTVRRCLPQG